MLKLLQLNDKQTQYIYLALVLVLLGCFTLVLVRNAWVSDDAYITFRTVDNFINGYGLTWNTGQRVQAYTHPLWMFLLAAVYLFTREIYYTSMILSLLVSLAAVVIFVWKAADNRITALAGIVLLACSKAFVDYTTSGLENPLTYLLLAWFFVLYFHKERSMANLRWLALVASLGVLNRMDTALIFIVPCLYAYIRTARPLASLPGILLGCLPLFCWLGFSLFYYGFLFPNTAYAKLNTGIATPLLYKQGVYYFYHTWLLDPVTLLIIVLGLSSFLYNRRSGSWPVSLGCLLYLWYVWSIGGDFMGGRFLAAPCFCAVMLLGLVNFKAARWGALPVTGGALLICLLSAYNPLASGRDYSHWVFTEREVADERGVYYPATGLLRAAENNHEPNMPWVQLGKDNRAAGPGVQIFGFMGFYGYYSGPDVHIIDYHALTDPLLARLPVNDRENWRIGHYLRNVPPGYPESIVSGENRFYNPVLGAYWEKLALVVSGKLWAARRFAEIININSGKYDYLLSQHNREQVDIPVTLLDGSQTVRFYEPGLVIRFPGRQRTTDLELNLEGNLGYRLRLLRGNRELAAWEIGQKSNWYGLVQQILTVPPVAAAGGYNRLEIYPLPADREGKIGYLHY